MTIAMENQCPAFKEQGIKEICIQVEQGCSISTPIFRHNFSRSIKLMGYGYKNRNAASFTLASSVSVDVYSYTLTNTGIDVMTIPASSAAVGYAGNIAVTDSIELAAADELIIQISPNSTPGFQFILRYKES